MDSETQYAGFWIRVGASLIDTLILAVPIIPILIAIYGERYWTSKRFLLGYWDFVLSIVVPAIAVVVFWVYRSATPGKLMFKMKIVDADTFENPTNKKLILRYFGYIVSLVPLFAGLAWVAFDKKKQGWHDKMANTVVIKTDQPNGK